MEEETVPPRRLTVAEYEADFARKDKEAFKVALEARKFEIQLYWTRTAYFWTLTGAALAGFFALEAQERIDKIFPFSVACVGAVLSFGWALANKGSKYWHENWEHHVQMLEDSSVGPLHKTVICRPKEPFALNKRYLAQVLVGPAEFSVSKINALFSWFFFSIWSSMIYFVAPTCYECKQYTIQWRYLCVAGLSCGFMFLLLWIGRSWLSDQKHWAHRFSGFIEDP